MENKILLRELENKENVHEIFEHQISKDVKELAKVIKKEHPNDLLVMFDPKEYKDKVEKIIFKETEEYRYGKTMNSALEQQTAMKIVDQYIALKVLENLSTKNTPLNLFFNENRLDIFKRGDYVAYEMFKDKMPNSDEVKEILTLDENAPNRIHFIVNGIKSNSLCDALCTYLDNSTTFATRIYLSPNGMYTATVKQNGKPVFLWEAYDYMIFDGGEEGYKPEPYRPKTKKVGQKKSGKV